MTAIVRYDGTGDTIEEYLACVSYDLIHDDSVGMWKIVPAGRHGFGLTGSDLNSFIGSYISALLEAGAKPVRAFIFPDGSWEWREQVQYGETPDKIVKAILTEWLALGAPNPEWDWLRFELTPYINKRTQRSVSPRNRT
jgi:hypothetical protein